MELDLYPSEFKHVLKQWLETFPEKITFGTDSFPYNEILGAEESYWLGVQSSRTALAAALAEMISRAKSARRRPCRWRMAICMTMQLEFTRERCIRWQRQREGGGEEAQHDQKSKRKPSRRAVAKQSRVSKMELKHIPWVSVELEDLNPLLQRHFVVGQRRHGGACPSEERAASFPSTAITTSKLLIFWKAR